MNSFLLLLRLLVWMELSLKVVSFFFFLGLGLVNEMVYSADLDSLYVLAASNQVIRVDLLCYSCLLLLISTLVELGCKQCIPATAMQSVTVNGATLSDLCEPLVPAMQERYVPVVSGV